MCSHNFGDFVSTLLHMMHRLQHRLFFFKIVTGKIEGHSYNLTLICSLKKFYRTWDVRPEHDVMQQCVHTVSPAVLYQWVCCESIAQCLVYHEAQARNRIRIYFLLFFGHSLLRSQALEVLPRS